MICQVEKLVPSPLLSSVLLLFIRRSSVEVHVSILCKMICQVKKSGMQSSASLLQELYISILSERLIYYQNFIKEVEHSTSAASMVI